MRASTATTLTVPGTAAAAAFYGPIDLRARVRIFQATAIILNVNGTVDSNSGSIVWNTDNIALAADVSGTGSITIQPITLTRSIGVNGAGSLSFTTTEINHIQAGFTDLQIGSPDGTGAVTVGASSFNDPVTILSPSGSMTVTGEITGSGTNSVTLHAGAIALQVAEPTPVISTQAGAIDLDGGVFLGANTKIVTTGGDITQDGTINGAFDLNVNAASGTVHIDGSSIPVNASIGGSTRLASIEVSGGVHNLQPLIYTTGSQSFTGTAGIAIHAGGMSSFVSGDITFTGPVLLWTDIGVITANGDAIFNNTVDNNYNLAGAHGALTIIAHNSNVDFNGDVGATSQLVGLTVSTAKDVTFDGALKVAGDISLNVKRDRLQGAGQAPFAGPESILTLRARDDFRDQFSISVTLPRVSLQSHGSGTSQALA